MDLRPWIWKCLAALPDCGVGSISNRKMGLAALLRMDVGQLRAMGLGSISLWSLVLLWKQLVLVAWTGLCELPSGVVSGICILCWLRLPCRLWFRFHRMVSRWSA